jgi:hypothetical protein
LLRAGVGAQAHGGDDVCDQPGVPPLLFAQVLYGRALYTSSVLIGVYWISIIGILMLTYWLLYRFTARLEAGKSAWWVGSARGLWPASLRGCSQPI